MTLPAVDSLATYGGALENYSPVVDPTTDEDATSRNKYAANVAMATHTLVRAIRSFVGVNGANPTDPVSGFVHDAVWGSTPDVKPTVARTGEGVWTVTWPEEVDDELDEEHTVSLQRAWAEVECDGTLYHATAKVTAANVVTVRGWLANGTADDLTGLTITVWAR
jgi:hypothetical protein